MSNLIKTVVEEGLYKKSNGGRGKSYTIRITEEEFGMVNELKGLDVDVPRNIREFIREMYKHESKSTK